MLKLAYASFGREPPEGLAGPQAVAVWIAGAVFLACACAATVVLNFFSLFAGSLIVFVGRPGVEFRFLRLFGQIPVIAVTLPVLFGYAIWHQSRLHGLWWIVGPIVWVWVLGVFSIAVAATWGWLTREWALRSRSSDR